MFCPNQTHFRHLEQFKFKFLGERGGSTSTLDGVYHCKTNQKYSTSIIPYVTIKSHPLFCITPIIHTPTLYIIHTYLLPHTHTLQKHHTSCKLSGHIFFNNFTPPFLGQTCLPITLINNSSSLSFFYLQDILLAISPFLRIKKPLRPLRVASFSLVFFC